MGGRALIAETFCESLRFDREAYLAFLVGGFEEKARLLQWLVFLTVQRDRSTFLFICSTS